LPSAIHSPCRAGGGLSPPSKCALPGAPKEKAPRCGAFLWAVGFAAVVVFAHIAARYERTPNQ
jgi:hypothetical protein